MLQGLGICVVGVSILIGVSYNSERIYLVYGLPGMALFLLGTFLRGERR